VHKIWGYHRLHSRFDVGGKDCQEFADGTISMDYDAVMLMKRSDLNRTNKDRYEKDCQQRSNLQHTAEAFHRSACELRSLYRLHPLQYFLHYRTELPLHHVYKVLDLDQR
jgi:hypothetical protein